MPKRILGKTSFEVSRLRCDGSYAVGGVSGPYLKIEGGSRAWVPRYVHGGHLRRMGVGSIDPLQARQAQREVARQVRFDDAAAAFFNEHESTWRSLKHVKQWRSTLPLSRQVLELFRAQPRVPLVEHVFPFNRKGPLLDMALTALMRRHELAAVPHGFRSTFRDWAGEMTHHARDAVELCLAHAIDTRTEAAYRHGDMLEKRAAIMQDWADFSSAVTAGKAP